MRINGRWQYSLASIPEFIGEIKSHFCSEAFQPDWCVYHPEGRSFASLYLVLMVLRLQDEPGGRKEVCFVCVREKNNEGCSGNLRQCCY